MVASGASPFVPGHLWDGGGVFLWLGPVSDSGSYQGADASYYMLEEEAGMGSSLAIGDVNGDGVIDLVDVEYTVDTILNSSPPFIACRYWAADVNGDGIVNVADVLVVIGNWGCSQ